MRVKHLVLAVTVLALSSLSVTACKKKVMTIEELASSSNTYTEESETDTETDETKKHIEETTEEVNDFSTKFDKRVVTPDKVEVVKVTDQERINELSGFMKASLNKTYTSIEYRNRTIYDIVVGRPEKGSRTVKGEDGKAVKEEYDTGNTVYDRFMGDNTADITRNNKYYHSLYVNDKTSFGYNTINVRDTYLIDNGEKTLSYSKMYDSNRDFPDRISYKAYIVDRNLEAENISFVYMDVLGNGEEFEVAEENADNSNFYTYKTLISLDKALDIANINKDILRLSDTAGYKTVIKLYFDRNTFDLKRAEVFLKNTLDKIQKEKNLGYSLQANSCSNVIDILSTENNTVVDIPEVILKKLPQDILANLDTENKLNKDNSIDSGLIMDGDFTVYGENKSE
jgi:lipoprotein